MLVKVQYYFGKSINMGESLKKLNFNLHFFVKTIEPLKRFSHDLIFFYKKIFCNINTADLQTILRYENRIDSQKNSIFD